MTTSTEIRERLEAVSETIDRCLSTAARILSRIESNQSDGLKAQAFDGAGGDSELTPTERAASERIEGKDASKAALSRIERIVKDLERKADALMDEWVRAMPRLPTRKDQRHVEDASGRPGCQSCARINRAEATKRTPAVPYFSEIWIKQSTVGGVLAQPLDLDRPCYDFIAKHKREKTPDELRASIARERAA